MCTQGKGWTIFSSKEMVKKLVSFYQMFLSSLILTNIPRYILVPLSELTFSLFLEPTDASQGFCEVSEVTFL